MALASKDDLEAAATLIRRYLPATPQYCWPLLSQRCETEVWVKHENHTPIGAFKVRGGIVYLEDLARNAPNLKGVITATRGNHGQSVAFAARITGTRAVIVVPHGNSREKNAAMQAFGGELIEHGRDFNEALDQVSVLADRDGLEFFPSFNRLLVAGVGTYSMELFSAVPDLDAVYVPIGLGSGICGAIAARDAAGSTADIIGVVAENAACYPHSFAAGKPVPTNTADTFADGLAVRIPDPTALEVILQGAARVVSVSEDEMKAAMRHYYTDTHNLAEGAGAAPLAALLKEKRQMSGKKVGLVLSGGNIDRDLYGEILNDVPSEQSSG